MIVRQYFLNILMAIFLAAQSMVVIAEQRAFNSDSIRQIEGEYIGKPFIIVLWEINCFPCHEELELLGVLKQSHPDINLVLVSTDNISLRSEINELMGKYQLTEVDSWLFSEPNVERLRYSIDPDWYGELPRNYFYDADSNRVAFSGKLTKKILDEWLSL